MVSCCSINMRIFKATELILLLFSIVYSTIAAPGTSVKAIRPSSDSTDPLPPPVLGDHFDQRQNGTENYRIHLDGLVVVVAPVEALLLAGGIGGAPGSDIFSIGQLGDIDTKPKPKPGEEAIMKPISKPDVGPIVEKPDGKSSHRPGLRLMSLLSPLLRRVHPHQ